MSVTITIKEEEARNLKGSGGEGWGAWEELEGREWREMMPLYFNEKVAKEPSWNELMRQTEGLKDGPGEEDEDGRDGGEWSREELRRDGDWLTFKSKGRIGGIFFPPDRILL